MEETEKEGGEDETSGIQTSSKESSVKQPNIRRRWKNFQLEYKSVLNRSDMINIVAIFDQKGLFVNTAIIQENILYVYLRKGMFLFFCFKYYFMLLNMFFFY